MGTAGGNAETTRTKGSLKVETVDLDAVLGAAIRRRRLQIGMTQTELALAIGISYQQIQKYEIGSNRVSVSALVGLARALGTTAAEIVSEVENGQA